MNKTQPKVARPATGKPKNDLNKENLDDLKSQVSMAPSQKSGVSRKSRPKS